MRYLGWQTTEASYGDASLASIAGGQLKPEPTCNSIASTVGPNPNNQEFYEKLHEFYEKSNEL